VRSLSVRNSQLAQRVIEEDRRVNLLEVEIDEMCLHMLALRQPAASDLRFITFALKIVTDLERIGDLAVNIAEQAADLNAQPPEPQPWVDIPKMAQIAQEMLEDVLDAFVAGDAEKARAVLARDDAVDELYHRVYRELIDSLGTEPHRSARTASILFVAKHLERIADHATNIAEMVIFHIEGRDVRHKGKISSS
jgi:phosphate transport system protein